MKLNQQLFKHSCANPEPDFDDAYTLRDNHDLLDEYFESAKSLTRILEKFNVEKDPNKKNQLIVDLLDNWGDYVSYMSFGGFINACGASRDDFYKNKKRYKDDPETAKKLLKEIVEYYVTDRQIDQPSKSAMQGLIDKGSSRRMGGLGAIKLQKILEPLGWVRKDSLDELDGVKKGFGLCSKSKFNLKSLRTHLNIEIKSADDKSQKALDFVIKCGDKYYLLEQKHMNFSGGGQNHQITDLISVIKYAEVSNKNVHYISFLDGRYFNDILLHTDDKSKEYISKIEQSLKETDNFWLNTNGFKEFLKQH